MRPSLDHVGIALANSAVVAIQVALLLFRLRRHAGRIGLRKVGPSAARILAQALVMTGDLLALVRRYEWLHPGSELGRRLVRRAVHDGCAVLRPGRAAVSCVSELGEPLGALQRRKNRAT